MSAAPSALGKMDVFVRVGASEERKLGDPKEMWDRSGDIGCLGLSDVEDLCADFAEWGRCTLKTE